MLASMHAMPITIFTRAVRTSCLRPSQDQAFWVSLTEEEDGEGSSFPSSCTWSLGAREDARGAIGGGRLKEGGLYAAFEMHMELFTNIHDWGVIHIPVRNL